MPKRELDRIDTHGPWRATACIALAVACSPGAPATETRSNVPDFATIPGVGRTPTNELSMPDAPGTAGMGSGGAVNEGNIPVGELEPSSPPEPSSDEQANAAAGAANVNPGEPPAAGEPSNGGDPPTPSEPRVGEASSATCALEVTVTTAPHGGRYTPRNVGAIWIANADGSYVKSLDVWGNRRLTHVEAWNSATEAAGVPQDRVDAVTGATSATHRTHLVSWDCTDHQGEPVPDGTYRVYFEVTEANGAGPNHFESFEKGATAVTLQANATNFQGIELAFQP